MKQLSEYQEQCLLVDYLELKKLKFSKIAQETFTKNWAVVMKNKKSGVRKGVPDLMVIIPQDDVINKLIFIEMKRKKGSVVSIEQLDWCGQLNKCLGVVCYFCYGFEEAKQVIDSELSSNKKYLVA